MPETKTTIIIIPKRTKEKMRQQKMPSVLMQKGTTLQLVATLHC